MKKTLKDLEKNINEKLYTKYKTDKNLYNKYIIENIIYNDKSHLVSMYKEFLLTDDQYDFFKRYYTTKESKKKLIKYIEYYQKYNFLYPNYTALPESEYLYQNINRKQAIIDIQQNDNKLKQSSKVESIKDDKKNKNIDLTINDTNKIFESKVYESILKSANKSRFSQFGVDKNNEKLDSIRDINQIITEINNMDSSEMSNIIKLNDSPAHPMHNNNIFAIKENLNIDINNNDKKVDRVKIYNKYIFNANYCYNKFKNKNFKNLLYKNNNNNNNQMGHNTNTPLSSNKINIFSPLYTKVNIRQKNATNIPDLNIIEPIQNTISNNANIKNKTVYLNKNINGNNNSNCKHSFIYKKLSPMNKVDKLNFFNKNNTNNNKESLKTITYFNINKKSLINPIEPKKKNSLKINYKFNENKQNMNNINNFSTKNSNTINNIIKKNLYLNNTEKIKNKFLYSKSRTHSELNHDFKNNNLFDFTPKENTIYIFTNNFINKDSNLINYNKNNPQQRQINGNNYKSLKGIQNRTKSLSTKKNSLNNLVKPCITDSIIDSISNRIKKESQNYISKRIYNIIKNKNNIKSSKKNTISLKKQLKINKIKQNKNIKSIKNKLISSLESNILHNKDTLGSLTLNSNKNNGINFLNKNPINNIKKKYVNNYYTPNSVTKHISFKKFANNNFSSINNTYYCQLFTKNDGINKANYTIYSTKNKKRGDNNTKNKFTYDINKLNNYKNLNTISGFKNKKLVINTNNNKKKILIIRKKENKINANNYNKNKDNTNNNKSKKFDKNKMIINSLKLREYEKIKILNVNMV